MLQYRQNINYTDYSRSSSFNLDEELQELRALLKYQDQEEECYELYKTIRGFIFKEIKIQELAVTRVLNDLHDIRKLNPKVAEIIEYFIANNTSSYKDIAEQFGCSKQNIDQILKKYSVHYRWLNNLVMVKGEEDAKNENNRQIFFKQKENKSTHYLWSEDISM